MTIKKGDKLKCIHARDISELTEGKIYIAAEDEQPGIFEDRPFVIVRSDNGKTCGCHASRFEVVSEE